MRNPEKYRPWILTRDFKHCAGFRTMVYDNYERRTLHFLSNIEYNYYLMCCWENETIQHIFEQVPLEINITKQIATANNIRHPVSRNRDNDEIYMTTDFVLLVNKDNNPKWIARAIKPESKVDIKRTKEKLEIERQFWDRQQVDWRLVTENDMDETFIWNLRLINERKYIIIML